MSEAKAIRDKLCIESECTFDRGCGCLEAIGAALATKDAEIKRYQEVIYWIDAWISNPVGSYSVSALDGLFAMTRDKISSLTSAMGTK
jgi:hypothetical protein